MRAATTTTRSRSSSTACSARSRRCYPADPPHGRARAIRVTGWHRRAPLVEFVRKGADAASITGEKLHVDQVVAAMGRAAKAAGLSLPRYCLQADTERDRYELLLDFPPPAPARAAVAVLTAALDDNLATLNVEYRAKRASGRLHAPLARVMPPGWCERWGRAPAGRRGNPAQAKPRVLSPVCDPRGAADALFSVECPERATRGMARS